MNLTDQRPVELSPEEEQRCVHLQLIALDFARQGETSILAEMLDAGLPVNLSDAKGQSLLMLASYHGHEETTRLLLERGADPDRRNDRGQNPLGGVAFKGYDSIAALLLEYGADIDGDNGAGMTPIMFASMFGRTSVVELLREHGASMKRRNRLGVRASWMVGLTGLSARLLRRRNSSN